MDLGRVVEVLIANRLTAPRPLYQVGTWLDTTVLPALWEIEPSPFNDDRLARCLDALHSHIEDLWIELITHAVLHYEVDVSCLLYDLTSFYFEGAYEGNDVITYGYSRDERPHTQQVVTATPFTHEGGVPLDYRVLPGNTAEASTVVENMQRVRRLLKRGGKPLNLLVISDAALLSEDIIAAYHQQPMGYLGRLRECKSVQQLMRSVSKEELLLHPLAYQPMRLRQQKDAVYYGVVREWSVTVGNETVEDQALIVYSPAKETLDAHKREQALSKLRLELDRIARRLNQRRYKRADYVRERIEKVRQGRRAQDLLTIPLDGEDGHMRLHYELNPETLADAQALDGKYVLATNRSHLSADEMLRLFKERDRSEKSHHVMKGPLRMRPIFLHTKERIESLVFIVMVALLIYTLMEQQVRQRLEGQMTARRLLNGLASWMAIRTEFADGSMSWQLCPLTPMQAQIIRALLPRQASAKLQKRLAEVQPP